MEQTHAIAALVIHRLARAGEGPSRVEARPSPNPIDAPAVGLMERLCRHLAERPGKGYGCFEESAEDYPMANLVHRLVRDKSLDFPAFSQAALAHLQLRVIEDGVEDAGFVVIARATVFGADCLYFALLQETVGSVIGEGLSIHDNPHLDFAGLQVAGRIDLTAWQAGAERYIAFLKGRGDVAGWFKRFLGCTDVVIALKETKKLVQTLAHFADTEQLEAPARDELLERAHQVLEEMYDTGAPLDLASVAAQVFPAAPQKLVDRLQDEAVDLATGFVPDKRALRPLIRFKAAAQDWKLEFERAGLRSGAVQYDPTNNTLMLTNVPEGLRRVLMEG